ncbi:TonB-dependent receptor [Novosphingobium sp.]|uniref:TonB-dependent receptor n=1 Tax=Novosphingobium sp. TaxID=1874826 RepID=UPI0031D1B3DE
MHITIRRTLGFSGASALAVCLASAAQAQEATPPAPGVADIIVTAQRRSESMQKVPIAVTAASAERLSQIGVASTSDLTTLAPAVHVSTGLGGASIAIRGVGGTGSGADESANAVYIDGVYQPSPTASLFAFNNIQRIEILKGPQGTLFGRNASGGLIQIITPAPSADTNLKAQIGYGNYDTVTAGLYATTGITDNLAIDVSGNYNHQGKGWGKNLTTGQDAYKGEYGGVRSKLLWTIDSGTSLTLAAMYSHAYAPNLQGGALIPGELTVVGTPGYNGFYNTTTNNDLRTGTDQQNYSATFKHDLGFATLTSITSRDFVHFRLTTEKDLSPVPLLNLNINSLSYSWTQEFQLASNGDGPLKWTLGAFYYGNELKTVPVQVSGLAVAPLAYADTFSWANTQSFAAYGQATYEIAKGTHLTGGLRYTIDKRHIDFVTTISDPTVPATTYPRQSLEDKKPSWRVALDQQATRDVLLYASYSRGFKSGLFNATNPNLPSVRPQTVDAYEIGLKSDLFSHKLRANIALFDNEVKDIQIRGIPNGLTTPIFYNGANASFKGVDLELEAAPARGLTAQANLSYLHGLYGAGFTNALYFTLPAAPAGGLIASVGDASGKVPVLAPELVLSLSAQYAFATPIGRTTLAGSYSYNDGFFFDPQNRVHQPAYGLFNGSVTVEMLPRISVKVWAENIGNKHYYSDVQPDTFGDAYFPAAPRTFGVTLSYAMR